MRKTIHSLSLVVTIFTAIAGGVGWLYTDGGASFTAISQYGNEIELYGNGLYKNDAAFLAPIFRGTDAVMFALVVPLLIIAILRDKKQKSFASLLQLTSLLFVVFYYAASAAFGVIFNSLHLVYTFLLSTSFFTLVIGMKLLENNYAKGFSASFTATRGLKIFVIVSGVALFGAWLPDIIASQLNDQPLTYLENYTTSVTYILDIGFLSPLLFISLYLLKKHTFYGVCLLAMLLCLSMLIGIILPVQTWFQIQSGLTVPLPALITKVAIFILLSVFAFYFNTKLFKQIK